MINNLPDDPDTAEDDASVKVAYHTAPISGNSEDQKIGVSEEPVEDPLDDEDPADPDPVAEKDPLDDEEPADQPISRSADSADIAENVYYLQTVKAGEQPEWEKPKEELDIFNQPIDDGLMQYFAYPKDLNKTADNVPNAELIASKNKSDNPVIIIDQTKDHLTPGCCLELILAKQGHALAKTDSNLDNLEANITSMIDLAKTNFGITVEHFVSTDNVSPEVEKRLDDLEDAGGEKENPDTEIETAGEASRVIDKPVFTPKSGRSKMVVVIPVLILIIMIGLIVFYRDNLLSIISPSKQEVSITPTPTQAPTPTPTAVVERSKYTVRVLNGTPKSGAAGVLADKLKEKGWLIDKTGNATSSAIAQSYVRGKVDIDEVIKTLIADVGDYEASASAVILNPTDKADLEFVIGKK